jgi:hypothetical protein
VWEFARPPLEGKWIRPLDLVHDPAMAIAAVDKVSPPTSRDDTSRRWGRGFDGTNLDVAFVRLSKTKSPEGGGTAVNPPPRPVFLCGELLFQLG